MKQKSLKVKDKKLSKIAFSHVGCEKNLVDTEHMQGLLDKEGYEVDSKINDANVVVVNTCSFIETAREESIRKILEYTNQGKEVIVAGCMAQHFKDELLKEIPEIKGLIGTGDYQKIAKVLERVEKGEIVNEVSKIPEFIADEKIPRFVDKNKFVAYLRIAEGCNYSCAFCIIPKLRGPQRSRTIESIVSEAKSLVKQGIQEIILISQITTNYGQDIYGKPSLAKLLNELSKVSIPWIRIHYAYPTGLTDEVIRAFKNSKNIVPYFDLPLQHSHPDVLKSMNRPWQASLNESILEKIREEIPSAVLRTSLIVGFPGEKKEHFEHLLAFLDRHKFDHVGVFIFSPEEGTAAFHLPNKVSAEVAEARKDNVISVQQNISKLKNQRYVGSKMKILVEKISDNNELIGRSYNFAPEIDGTVILSVKEKIDLKNFIGKFVEANISFVDEYDLYGETIKLL
ncbi:MAG: 30S ribosomal protein S12 methylthiotransferase RimO [Prochlorococcus marinus CUG1431]|uniref:Ribosomal protein uS12 methylthiotransferase RimO n=1 Tax=Prochlorococcus marinus CUG1433 TaxID=2774506 RepID=A0A9D9BV81_PROMR|nr:30S ribosomal protein S12 methylthiotransferase RimO [Prochlorococcus marinus CUG1433]MBO6980123.1 30S ribosomal protein S12 methylthiotransferase RimO [Prochlorococcus marinus CUG1431]